MFLLNIIPSTKCNIIFLKYRYQEQNQEEDEGTMLTPELLFF